MSDSVGFIGVGAMGSAIASRLVGSYDLYVNDRTRAAADGLVDQGATFATVQDIARLCGVVFLCLPGPAQVSDLVLAGGLAVQLQPGAVLVDTSTSTPTTDAQITQALTARGVDFVDAPIGGGVRRAQDGTAVLMVGAASEVFGRVEHLLRAVTDDVIHVGPVGAGHTMKLVNNLLNCCNRFAALEAIKLGELGGIERDVVVEVLNRSSGRNYATEYTFPTLLSGESWLPQGFTIGLMRKDLNLATSLADALGHRTPLGHLVESFTDEAITRFGADADQSQMMAQWFAE